MTQGPTPADSGVFRSAIPLHADHGFRVRAGAGLPGSHRAPLPGPVRALAECQSRFPLISSCGSDVALCQHVVSLLPGWVDERSAQPQACQGRGGVLDAGDIESAVWVTS